MIGFLRSIPGPVFLFIFPSLVALGCLLGRMALARLEGAPPTPNPSRFSPEEMATLKGGWDLVLQTAIFSLWSRKIVEIVSGNGNPAAAGEKIDPLATQLLQCSDLTGADLSSLEREVCSFLREPHAPADILKDPHLKEAAVNFCSHAHRKWEQIGLRRDAAGKRRAWKVTMAVFAGVYGIGIAKLILGITYHKPYSVLVLMLIVAIPVILLSLWPWGDLTFAGKKYLKRVVKHFAWARKDIQNGREPRVDPGLVFAIFGPAILAGAPLYASFADAFPMRSHGGCSGGGGGIHSSGGCGSGGCGGGGGCGGCGGGD